MLDMRKSLCHVQVSVIGTIRLEDHEGVWNSPHADVKPRAIYIINIHRVQELILRNREIKVRDIASNINIS
jgi:hypothetical protein